MYWLTTPHDIPGVENSISTITGLYQSVQWLTIMLVEKNFDFGKCKVKSIYSVGGFVTSRWKKLMKTLWSAKIIPVYSLTEVFTHSNCCLLCGSYHFLPNVVPELICPVEQTPMTEGGWGIGSYRTLSLYSGTAGNPFCHKRLVSSYKEQMYLRRFF
jgi:phenylacetate-coenzyme A ligase PaaK-like adenylate-forming protein